MNIRADVHLDAPPAPVRVGLAELWQGDCRDVPPPLTVLDLFSGIGGFSLGLERTGGFRTVAFCEIDGFCRRVLAKYWPGVPIHTDVRELCAEHVGSVDVVCGGPPCQPYSSAARGRVRGDADDRHLWPEAMRLVAECRPTWVLLENVTHFDRVALEPVAATLEALGYEVAPPLEIPACAVGCDHWRPRLWLLGHAHGHGQPGVPVDAEVAGLSRGNRDAGELGAPYGLSRGLDSARLRALGNAVVPQVVEVIGRAILEAESSGWEITP